jgi:hypothetical protein
MQSRNFPTVANEFLRGQLDNTKVIEGVDYEHAMRGVERNTARGVTNGAPELIGITPVEYAPATDAPESSPFKTYGE